MYRFNNITVKTFCTLLGSFVIAGSVNAATLNVTNKEASDLSIVVEPGEGKTLPGNTDIKVVLKAGETKEIEVKEAEIGAKTFSVTGKISATKSSKCGVLLTDKNYTINFANSNCQSKEDTAK